MLNAVQDRVVEEALVEKGIYEAMQRMRAQVGGVFGTSDPEDAQPKLPELPVSSGKGPRSGGRAAAAGAVPAEVMAVADPLRDPNRRVAPFIPETMPKDGRDPFPDLGPKGRPLG